MTLIVGNVGDIGVRLLCDSQITNREAAHPTVIPGRLKLVLLNSELCVGFAGNANIAIDAIRASSITDDFERVAQYLLQAHLETDLAADFLIASHNVPRLDKIADGRRFTGGRTHWIGDVDAVNQFSAGLDSMPDVPIENPEHAVAAKVYQVFLRLLVDQGVATVGGLPFAVVPGRGGFRYALQAGTFCPSQVIPSGRLTALTFGGAADGGFAYSTYASQVPGIAAVGVYFLQGQCGVLYMPLVEDEARWFTDLSQEEFRKTISALAGTPLVGLGFG